MPSTRRPSTILIADDDESIRLLLSTLLEEAGYRTILAENGQAAVQLAVEHKPDIAILDVMMPGLDGLETCRAIKVDQRTANIQVLLLSALAHTPTLIRGLDYGASDYITKPFVANELLARLRKNLAQKSQHDALVAALAAYAPPSTRLVRQLRVFLCHSSDDKPAVRALYYQLQAEGDIDPWLDEEKLLGGHNWEHEIRKAIRDADVVVACLSTSSVNKRGFVQKEIALALDETDELPEGTIHIIPLRLEICTVPDRLSRWHWVDLFANNGYERLLKALRERTASLGPVLLADAPEDQ